MQRRIVIIDAFLEYPSECLQDCGGYCFQRGIMPPPLKNPAALAKFMGCLYSFVSLKTNAKSTLHDVILTTAFVLCRVHCSFRGQACSLQLLFRNRLQQPSLLRSSLHPLAVRLEEDLQKQT